MKPQTSFLAAAVLALLFAANTPRSSSARLDPTLPAAPLADIFTNSGQSLGGETGNGVALGDLDGDGDLDAFVANDFSEIGGEANQIWCNQGNGTFVVGPTLGATDGYAVALGDLDGDDDLDALVVGPVAFDADPIQVWLNQIDGDGCAEGAFIAGASFGTFSSYGVALGDVDNDDDLDALVVGNSNQLWLNDGDAAFIAGPTFPFVFSKAAALIDLDGDGFLDALIADSADGGETRVWWNDGNWEPGPGGAPGTFTPGDPLPTVNLVNGAAVGNLDDDILPDILLAASGPEQVYWNDGEREFSSTGPWSQDDSSWAVAVADVDGDDDLDAVVANITADPNRLWRNEGSRVFAVAQEFGDETGFYWSRGVGLADLDGDDLVDLFEVTTADDRVWFNGSLPAAPDLAWQEQTVAQRGRTGLGNSLALDANGRPHVAYVERIERPNEDDYRLFYATWDGQQWVASIVDTAYLMAASTSLALDSFGRPHIVYESNEEDSLDERVRYAAWDGNQWQRQTVYLDAEPQGHFSLALDAQDRPHIAFYLGATAQDLAYARRDEIQWQIETVDAAADVGRFNSLALDESGNPHIAYHDYTAQELKYATRSGGGPWQVSVVDGTAGAGEYASLALDSAGRPHIGYERDGGVQYARYDGNAWQFESVPVGFLFAEHTVLALDANDDPHLIWNDFADATVRYTRRSGSGWQTEIAATAPFWGGHDLAVDNDLKPHISFYHGDYGDLRYAVLDAPWQVQPLDAPGLVELPSLALPVGGHDQPPEFAYHKPQAGLLRRAAWDEAMWQLTGVDFIDAAGADPSLAIGNDSRPRVSYYDADSRQLRYAAWDGSAWQSEVVDLNVGTGRFSNLLLEGTRPTIVYWDNNVRRIRLARWNPFANLWEFTINLITPAAAGSGYLSAARLSDGRIAVSYFQASGGQLRLAIWDGATDGAAWSDTLIASGLAADAPYNALAVDAVENEPVVAYYLQASQQIIYAFRQGGSWQMQTAVEEADDVSGLALQLALESHRQPRIAYVTGDTVRLASGQDGSWRDELVYEEEGVTLDGVSFVLGRRQHIAVGSSDGLRYIATLAASSGPEPWILTPYDPISPFLACFEFLFDSDDESVSITAAIQPEADGGLDGLDDLGVFLAMTPLFRATPGGQRYVDLYGEHVQELTGIVLDDIDLLRDSYGTLQNFLPGLEAFVSGNGGEVAVTQQMVDDALDIWQRLAAAGSPGLAAVINAELARYHNLQDFVGMTFDEWVESIGVPPPPKTLYLPRAHEQ